MIVLRTPKGWTGPREVDGVQVEGTWRAHQVPPAETRGNAAHRELLEQWLRSYRPGELFDATGRLVPELQALAPQVHRRMSANPHANGGLLLRDLVMPDFRRVAALRQQMSDARLAARAYTREHGADDPAITGWTWAGRD